MDTTLKCFPIRNEQPYVPIYRLRVETFCGDFKAGMQVLPAQSFLILQESFNMKFKLGDKVKFVSDISGAMTYGVIIGIGDDRYRVGCIECTSNEVPFDQALIPEILLSFIF